MSHNEYYRGLEAAQQALADCATDDPARRASAVHEALAPMLDDTPARAHRACHQGCAHCCHFPVGITFAETARLADALEGNDGLQDAVRREHEATIDAPWDALAGRPCPLLQGSVCGSYVARPMPCRALASSDDLACERALHGNASVPTDDIAFARGLGATAALAGSPDSGNPDSGSPDSGNPDSGTRELRAALAAVVAVPRDARAAAFAAVSRRLSG